MDVPTTQDANQQQNVPQEETTSPHDALKTQVIRILSKTANDCLSELGYNPALFQRLEQLTTLNRTLEADKATALRTNASLHEDNTLLFNDNKALHQLITMQHQHLQTAAALVQARDREIADLKARVHALTEERDKLLRTQDAFMAASGQAYRKLEAESQQLLSMHQAVKQEASQWRDKLLNLQQVAQDTQAPASHPQDQRRFSEGPSTRPTPSPISNTFPRHSSEGVPSVHPQAAPRPTAAPQGQAVIGNQNAFARHPPEGAPSVHPKAESRQPVALHGQAPVGNQTKFVMYPPEGVNPAAEPRPSMSPQGQAVYGHGMPVVRSNTSLPQVYQTAKRVTTKPVPPRIYTQQPHQASAPFSAPPYMTSMSHHPRPPAPGMQYGMVSPNAPLHAAQRAAMVAGGPPPPPWATAPAPPNGGPAPAAPWYATQPGAAMPTGPPPFPWAAAGAAPAVSPAAPAPAPAHPLVSAVQAQLVGNASPAKRAKDEAFDHGSVLSDDEARKRPRPPPAAAPAPAPAPATAPAPAPTGPAQPLLGASQALLVANASAATRPKDDTSDRESVHSDDEARKRARTETIATGSVGGGGCSAQPSTPGVSAHPGPDDTEDGDEDEDEDGEEEDEDEVIEVDRDGLRPVERCVAAMFKGEPNEAGERVCMICKARYDAGLLPTPPQPFVRPSFEELLEHCQFEHDVAWKHLRTTVRSRGS